MSELDDLRSDIAALREAITAKNLNEARDSAAAVHGLPPSLAKRIQGSTPEEIEADARLLAGLVGGSSSAPAAEDAHEQVERVLEIMRGRKSGPSEASQVSVHLRKGGGVVGI